MNKAISIFSILLFLLPSCKQRMGADGYAKYVQSVPGGLKKEIGVNGWLYTIQYKPHDYIALQETKGAANAGEAAKIRGRLQGTAWFNISFRRADGSISPLRYMVTDTDGYESRLDYFLNTAKKEVALVYGNDTLPPCSYVFENNFNLAPMETMVVGFLLPGSDKTPSKAMKLVYNDVVFKNGVLEAEYHAKALDNIPELIF